ncbi:MAG: N-acetyltransferase [Gammaproteobacteria bacterium]|nr:MAG: N-acetyltransferase [Gammaproteobacteria bacterium]
MTDTAPPLLTTERLILRTFSPDDFEVYAALMADPRLMEYVGDGKPQTRGQAWANLALLMGHWHMRGYGLWAVVLRDSGRLIGRCGLWHPEGWPGVEIGWMLAREYWGQGYATEAASAVLAYAQQQRLAESLVSLIHPSNARSIAVAQRLGGRFERTLPLRGQHVSLYRIPLNPKKMPRSEGGAKR